MILEQDRRIVEEVKQGLKPPTKAELDRVTARWLFGTRYADLMMRYAPWSFVLLKLMWKKGEEPWAS
jgi:hypothetical protein